MSDESIEPEPEEKRGLSRRNALKAGVAVGVGVAAWSGASITSLGGTPAYAALATAAIIIDLSGGCRNTDQSSACPPPTNAPFRYHTLNSVPAPFKLDPTVPEGTCCDVATATLKWTTPPFLTCAIRMEIWTGLQACKDRTGILVGQGDAAGIDGVAGVAVPLNCGFATIPSNAFYTIVAACNTRAGP